MVLLAMHIIFFWTSQAYSSYRWMIKVLRFFFVNYCTASYCLNVTASYCLNFSSIRILYWCLNILLFWLVGAWIKLQGLSEYSQSIIDIDLWLLSWITEFMILILITGFCVILWIEILLFLIKSDMPIVLCIFNLLFTVPLGTYCLQVSKNRFQPQLIVYNAGKTSWMVFDWANWRYFSPINSYLHKHKPPKLPPM